MQKLISFDIDGTLEAGDPPGWITMEMVRRAKHLGWVIGSASDRPVPVQQRIWDAAGITVDFTVPKHTLDTVRQRFPAEAYFHIGDTDMDRHYAVVAGFEFLPVLTSTAEEWMFNDLGIHIAPPPEYIDIAVMGGSLPVYDDTPGRGED